MIMDRGNSENFTRVCGNFSSPVDANNEELCYEFLMESIDKSYSQLKPASYYEDKIQEIKNSLSIDQPANSSFS